MTADLNSKSHGNLHFNEYDALPEKNRFLRNTNSSEKPPRMSSAVSVTNKSVSFNLHPYTDPPGKSTNISVGRVSTKIINKLPPKEVSLEVKDISLESNIVLIEALKQLEGFIEKPFKEAIYIGVMVDGLRHGVGIMKYRNGRQYEGHWFEDIRDGKGFERYPNGNTYFGHFKTGKAHGNGVYTWFNGEVYDGEWDQGLKHGRGIWKGVENDSYVGEWSKSKAHGFGVHTWPNGDKYEGLWNMCLKHGTGTDTFYTGDIYTGQYLEG